MVILVIVWGFSSHSRIFNSYGDVTFAGEGLQSLTYPRHSWPLSTESSLACPPTVTRASVYNSRLRGPVTLTPIAERFAVELSLPVFTIPVCRGRNSNTQPSACRVKAVTHCIMSVKTCKKIMLTCQLFMSTCQSIMSISQKKVTTSSRMSCFKAC